MSFKHRRYLMSGIFIFIFIIITSSTALVAWSAYESASPRVRVTASSSPLLAVSRVPLVPATSSNASSVPVLVYHEMGNRCAATAPVCHSPDYESVSTAQFAAEMGWMHHHGYHTITLPQYLRWLADKKVKLPAKPFLITVDNGIGNFLEGAQPVLWHYRYTATAFIVTGFADGAAQKCGPRVSHVNVQPECPFGNMGWDLTWPQLRSLSPAVYGFGIEAGAAGHYQQVYDKKCYAFDACQLPHESGHAYQMRIRAENSRGIAELAKELGNRFDSHAWVVPYSDLGYTCGSAACSSFEGYDGPSHWLASYAATTFHAVFVQDAIRNGIHNERFRYEVHSLTTLPEFTDAIHHYTTIGSWDWR